MRNLIFNGELGNDLDAKGFAIKNLKGAENSIGGTTYVDSTMADDNGVIGSSRAFKTIAAALAATPSNYMIIIRPGIYSYDGSLQVGQNNLRIVGYGAVIKPVTTKNAGFIIAGRDVQISGIEFDGLLAQGDTPTNATTGAVILFGAQNCLLRDLVIHDQNGVGIELRDQYDGVKIEGCSIQTCYKGVTGAQGAGSISSIVVRENYIALNRWEGIVLTGTNNTAALRGVDIIRNRLNSNDSANQNKAAISMPAGGQDVSIKDNYTIGHAFGISVTKLSNFEISGNNIVTATSTAILVTGHQIGKINSNIINGYGAGIPRTNYAIRLLGDYAATNDSGPYEINGNLITGVVNSGFFFNVANANNGTIAGNNCMGLGACAFAAFAHLDIVANTFSFTANGAPLLFDAAERGTSGLNITGNKISASGTMVRLIAFADTLGHGHTSAVIGSNEAPDGYTYSQGIVSAASGSLPTSITIVANSPISRVVTAGSFDNRSGWVNDSAVAAASKEYQVLGVRVVRDRVTGFIADTGTAEKISHATYTSPNISGSYVEAEVQAIADALEDVSRGQKALKDALIFHGLIGQYAYS